MRTSRNVLVFLATMGVSSHLTEHAAHCRWVLDSEGDRFERMMLAGGYAKMHMYDESVNVLEGLRD